MREPDTLPAFYRSCTTNQIRAQYAKNAAGLYALARRAERTGRKVNGKDAAYWYAKADEYARRGGEQ